MEKKYFIFLFLGFIFIGFICSILSDWLVKEDLKEPPQSVVTAVVKSNSPPEQTPKLKAKTTVLVPDDPKEFGIIVQDATEIPRNEANWEQYMQKAVIDSKILEAPDAQSALKAMEKTPTEFNTRLQEIDQRIELFQKKKNENPADEETEQRLQTLYMLKALAKALEPKVINNSGTEPVVPSQLPSDGK